MEDDHGTLSKSDLSESDLENDVRQESSKHSSMPTIKEKSEYILMQVDFLFFSFNSVPVFMSENFLRAKVAEILSDGTVKSAFDGPSWSDNFPL